MIVDVFYFILISSLYLYVSSDFSGNENLLVLQKKVFKKIMWVQQAFMNNILNIGALEEEKTVINFQFFPFP